MGPPMRPYIKRLLPGWVALANELNGVLDAVAALKWRGRGDIEVCLIGDGQCKFAHSDRANRKGSASIFL